MIASKILIYDENINPIQWNFYLRGGLSTDQMPDNLPSFVTEKLYRDFLDLSNISSPFKSVLKDLLNKDNENIWKKILEEENPLDAKLPENL